MVLFCTVITLFYKLFILCANFFDWPARNSIFIISTHFHLLNSFLLWFLRVCLTIIIPGTCGFTVLFRLPDFFWDLAKVLNKNTKFESLQCYSTSLNMLLMIKLVPNLYQKRKMLSLFFILLHTGHWEFLSSIKHHFWEKLWKQRNFQK